MKKITKRIAAMGAAVMMMASMGAMGASAYTNTVHSGAYCTAYKSTTSGVHASTSSVDGSNSSVRVNIIIYYTKSGNTLTIGNGNAGVRATSAYCNTPSGGTFKSAKIAHTYKSATVYTGSLF